MARAGRHDRPLARAELARGAVERLGYVERVPDAADGRAKLVRPTDRGHAAVRSARATMAEIEQEWARLLGPHKLEQLRELLAELHAKLWPPG